MNFIIAGRDTTAQLLSWFLYEMTKIDENNNKVNYLVEEKIRNEINTVLAKHNGYVFILFFLFLFLFLFL